MSLDVGKYQLDLQVWNRTCLDSFQESTHSHYVTTATNLRPLSGVELYSSQGTVCTRGVRAPTCAVASVRNLRSREAVGCQWLHLDCNILRKLNRRAHLKMFCISKLVATLKSVVQKLGEKYGKVHDHHCDYVWY